MNPNRPGSRGFCKTSATVVCGLSLLNAAAQEAVFPRAANLAEPATRALQIVGNYLFVAAWGYGVQVLDISDPKKPKWHGGWNPRRCPMGIHVVGNYAYVANRRAGLSVLDVRDPANPVWVGTGEMPGDAQAVYVSGHRAYVADYASAFRVFDVRDPTRPSLLGSGALPQGALSLQLVENYAYVVEPQGLHIFDVSQPHKPVRVGGTDSMPLSPFRVQIVGRRAYLATGWSGMLVLDLANPAAPQMLDRLMAETNNLPIVMSSSGTQHSVVGWAWMLTNAGLRAALTKRHPDMPQDISQIVAAVRRSPFYFDYVGAGRDRGLSRHVRALHVTDRYALALSGNALEVVDISEPDQPKLMGRCSTRGSWDVRAAGRYAYVMDNGANIEVIDLGDPARPVVVGRFDSRGYCSAVLVADASATQPGATATETYPDVSAAVNAPELTDPEQLPDGAYAFTLKGHPGLTYVVQASTNLHFWVAVRTNTMPASGQIRFVDPAAREFGRRFFRAVQH